MRESIGNAYILYIVAFFIAVIMLFFAASLNYTKAFKVKNRIVNILEENQGYNDSTVRSEIEDALGTMHYMNSSNPKCPTASESGRFEGSELLTTTGNTNYLYCIYKYDMKEKGYYYGVMTYMYFQIPIINITLKFPVYGETKTMGEY
jgi:hypothetical protein